MSSTMTWKLALIAGAVGLSIWLFYPPKEKINLGLDLQGGSHLVAQVDTTVAVKSEIDVAINRIGQMLKEKSINYTSIGSSADGVGINIAGVDSSRAKDVREILETNVPRWTVTPLESDWSIRMPDSIRQQVEASSIETTLTVMRQRVDELGVKE